MLNKALTHQGTGERVQDHHGTLGGKTCTLSSLQQKDLWPIQRKAQATKSSSSSRHLCSENQPLVLQTQRQPFVVPIRVFGGGGKKKADKDGALPCRAPCVLQDLMRSLSSEMNSQTCSGLPIARVTLFFLQAEYLKQVRQGLRSEKEFFQQISPGPQV